MNENTSFILESAIGKIEFAYASPFWISEIDGVSSVDIDISQSQSSGQVGSSIANQSVQPKAFTIDGAIFDPVQTNRRKLIEVVAPQTNATLTVKIGVDSWYLDVVPERTPDISPGNGMQNFQLRLYAAYPYWRSTTSYAHQVAGLTAMFKFPFFTGGKWWISKFNDSYFSEIENSGNVPIEFQVIFTARSALSSPELYHMGTRRRIKINKDMIAGERVIVSTMYGKKGVTCISASGETSNGFKYLSIDSDLSMSLIPGINLLRIDADSNREGLGARVEAPKEVRSGV